MRILFDELKSNFSQLLYANIAVYDKGILCEPFGVLFSYVLVLVLLFFCSLECDPCFLLLRMAASKSPGESSRPSFPALDAQELPWLPLLFPLSLLCFASFLVLLFFNF